MAFLNSLLNSFPKQRKVHVLSSNPECNLSPVDFLKNSNQIKVFSISLDFSDKEFDTNEYDLVFLDEDLIKGVGIKWFIQSKSKKIILQIYHPDEALSHD